MHIALKEQLNDRIGDCLTLEFAGNRLRCLERPMLSELVRRQATLADLKIVAALGAGIDATTYRLKSCKEARVARQPLKRARIGDIAKNKLAELGVIEPKELWRKCSEITVVPDR